MKSDAQVTDVEIDKINKPYLPIPSGDLSKPTAIAVVVSSLIIGMILGFWPSPFTSYALQATITFSALLGTIYSVPPFRLKRFPLLAAMCIVAVRGSIVREQLILLVFRYFMTVFYA